MQELRGLRSTAHTLEGVARMAIQHSEQSQTARSLLVRAARLFGAAEKIRETIDAPHLPDQRPVYERSVAHLRAQLDHGILTTAWTEGRAVTVDHAIAYALDETLFLEGAFSK